jgi:acetylornithine deacetylase/succinyl-diaminopimelate desuccinylase-like protein
MNERLKNRLSGLKAPLVDFSNRLYGPDSGQTDSAELLKTIVKTMKSLNFDKVTSDEVGNIIGVIDGYRKQEDMVLLCNIDLGTVHPFDHGGTGAHEGSENYKMGIITSLFTAALLKRSIAAMNGDLIVACVPRQQACDFGIQYLFENFLAGRKIKGIILAEPTDFNVCIGNKGKMEYEIIVDGIAEDDAAHSGGYNMMSSMFPLIKELEDVAKRMPRNCELGSSLLKIKDISYGVSAKDRAMRELHVLVDRTYIPEETSDVIIQRACDIAQNVFRDNPEASVSAVMTKNRVKTITGKELVLRNQYEPWKMESHNPFVLGSLEVLRENGIQAGVQYWKKIITEGSFTYGKLGIPTIGFGAGVEGEALVPGKSVLFEDIEKSCLGKALIVYRNIGFPTFGWSDDEI